jgi:hypothetical protein
VEIFTMILLIFLALKLVDLVRYIVNADMNGVITQVLAWLAGILVVYLTVWAEWTTEFIETWTWTRLLWGVLLGSAAGVAHDLLKAIAKTSVYSALIVRGNATPTTLP